ncbi:MAG: hypothetical protein M1313_10935 [Nitrospirae bacterium]|nr:hypothetical protein [Nitrospirota bacterium]
MSESRMEGLAKRLTVTKELIQKRKADVAIEERKSDSELRRLKKIVRRVANKKRRLTPAAEGASAKES